MYCRMNRKHEFNSASLPLLCRVRSETLLPLAYLMCCRRPEYANIVAESSSLTSLLFIFSAFLRAPHLWVFVAEPEAQDSCKTYQCRFLCVGNHSQGVLHSFSCIVGVPDTRIVVDVVSVLSWNKAQMQ